MRADRLVAILLLLQTHGRLTVRAIAERLEVSPRTVVRDLEALAMSGVPVYAVRGRGGGWALADAYRTDLTGLTEAELRSLVVATAPSVLADLGLGEAAERALVKVLAALPEERRRAAEASRRYLHVDPSGWRRHDEVAPVLPVLDEALRAGRRVAMRYERAGDRTAVDRTVDPLGLVAKGSTWYLIAAVGGEPRTYRASRIREARMLEEPAARPADFDLAAYWQRSREAFVAELPRAWLTLRVSPTAAPRVRHGWRFAAIEAESPPDPDGWIPFRVRTDGPEIAVEIALALGPDAEVIDPPETRRAVLDRAAALLERAHAPSADGAPGHRRMT